MRPLRLKPVALAAALLAGAVAALPADPARADGRALAKVADAGAPDAARSPASPASRAKIPPDPPPLSERAQWVYDLRWDRGEIYLVAVHAIDTGSPHRTPRAMGRFALELFEGPTLIERVRFDFPMLGGPLDAGAGGYMAPPRLDKKLKTRIGVMFPATKRGTRLELWDRASDQRWPLPWPPVEGPVPPRADAGALPSP